jgi:hypothetical protein
LFSPGFCGDGEADADDSGTIWHEPGQTSRPTVLLQPLYTSQNFDSDAKMSYPRLFAWIEDPPEILFGMSPALALQEITS